MGCGGGSVGAIVGGWVGGDSVGGGSVGSGTGVSLGAGGWVSVGAGGCVFVGAGGLVEVGLGGEAFLGTYRRLPVTRTELPFRQLAARSSAVVMPWLRAMPKSVSPDLTI